MKEEEYIRKREEAKVTKAAASAHLEAPDAADVNDEDQPSDLNDNEDMDEEAPNDSTDPMSALLASARARAAEYGHTSDQDQDDEMAEDDSEGRADLDEINCIPISPPKHLEGSRRAFDKVFRSVLSSSDIVLYVLDARSPNGTRSREIEREIAAADAGSKLLILILNKIDLIPPPALKAWLTYLGRSFPTIPLRANNPAANARTFDHKALTVRGTSETLLRVLKSYAAKKNLKRSTTVGIVGYPNVGKSSVINALTSRLGSSRSSITACPVGAEAGVTTALREVKLDNKLKLLDSPGIVFPSSSDPGTSSEKISNFTPKQLNQANLTLLSALPPSGITDPIPAITLLLYRLSRSEATLAPLLDLYSITPDTLVPTGADGDVTTDFLLQVAKKRGRLGKRGVPNLHSAAMGVLMDWRDGRIRGWVEAPKEDVVQGYKDKEIVAEWKEEFKIEGLWGDDGMLEGNVVDEEVMEE